MKKTLLTVLTPLFLNPSIRGMSEDTQVKIYTMQNDTTIQCMEKINENNLDRQLLIAVLMNDLALAETSLAHGADVNATIACDLDEEILNTLLNHRAGNTASIDTARKHMGINAGNSALHLAIQFIYLNINPINAYFDSRMINLLLSQPSIDTSKKNAKGDTASTLACLHACVTTNTEIDDCSIIYFSIYKRLNPHVEEQYSEESSSEERNEELYSEELYSEEGYSEEGYSEEGYSEEQYPVRRRRKKTQLPRILATRKKSNPIELMQLYNRIQLYKRTPRYKK